MGPRAHAMACTKGNCCWCVARRSMPYWLTAWPWWLMLTAASTGPWLRPWPLAHSCSTGRIMLVMQRQDVNYYKSPQALGLHVVLSKTTEPMQKGAKADLSC